MNGASVASRKEERAMKPRLAAVYTTFNSMRTIERSIASVGGIAQRVIVVDSGSTDGTVQAC